ncbi:MAG: hypothetical protein HY974_03010 [Candidatus Kerfeldbacteria bacterium]|nr:hypothetical protein [Candidatus Kerfeldbacteria bacterium]
MSFTFRTKQVKNQVLLKIKNPTIGSWVKGSIVHTNLEENLTHFWPKPVYPE